MKITLVTEQVLSAHRATQSWAILARRIVADGSLTIEEAYAVSEKWEYLNSPYELMERDLESKEMGISAFLTRLVAACHVLRHSKAINPTRINAKYWMESFLVARHAGTMRRADMLVAQEEAKANRGRPGADAKHAANRANRETALRMFQEGGYPSIAEAARRIAEELNHSAKTVDKWLRAFRRGH